MIGGLDFAISLRTETNVFIWHSMADIQQHEVLNDLALSSDPAIIASRISGSSQPDGRQTDHQNDIVDLDKDEEDSDDDDEDEDIEEEEDEEDDDEIEEG